MRAAFASIVARQRNESCNAKEFLQDKQRMAALFEDIARYNEEVLNFNNIDNKVSLRAVIIFFKNKMDVFTWVNFFPPDVDGNSVTMLVMACYFYAVC